MQRQEDNGEGFERLEGCVAGHGIKSWAISSMLATGRNRHYRNRLRVRKTNESCFISFCI